MNEKMVPDAMDISKRIELVTGLGLYHEQFASENYHVMNYGIGGSHYPKENSSVVTYGPSLNMTILTSQIFRKQIRIALSELYQTALWDDS